ncbi:MULTISPECIES: hypothetical protein [Komagataeibacter]|uniref:Uncharacterized protein n=2 Tax=Komagataeibacter TaxID=1434011 RepID=A0A318QUG7_9PROT|nr:MULTISPECIES: hypothetical protein [Komagataeibacter]GBQ05733.1 hypothetical protein AA11826_2167 [Komagataeibacter oboediens DSM 11826]MBL7232344.1 hypothetical protein [Komagataeibacter oboediens]MBT0674623.1 hypothetical protein [Komagataeibacter oboediens]MBT0677601.1 hypothetical protein [Komagataeibacter oboediens]MBV0887395.1 hypothetical protein [Komagataeibacter oboediens]
MTTMINTPMPSARSVQTRRAVDHAKSIMREMWIVPMVVMGSVLCGGIFTLLSHLLGHAG